MVARLDSSMLTCCAVYTHATCEMLDGHTPVPLLANILRIKLPLYVTVNVIFKVSSPILVLSFPQPTELQVVNRV